MGGIGWSDLTVPWPWTSARHPALLIEEDTEVSSVTANGPDIKMVHYWVLPASPVMQAELSADITSLKIRAVSRGWGCCSPILQMWRLI